MLNQEISAKFKFAYIVSKQKIESILILAVSAILFGIGLLFGDGNNHNYIMLFEFAHRYAWAFLFLSYGIIKLISLVGDLDFKVKIINEIIGLWSWNYLFLSFVVFDSTPVTPAEFLLALPILIESCILTSTVNNKNKDKL